MIVLALIGLVCLAFGFGFFVRFVTEPRRVDDPVEDVLAAKDREIDDKDREIERLRRDKRNLGRRAHELQRVNKGWAAECRRLVEQLNGIVRQASAALADRCAFCTQGHDGCGCQCHQAHRHARANLGRTLASLASRHGGHGPGEAA